MTNMNANHLQFLLLISNITIYGTAHNYIWNTLIKILYTILHTYLEISY